MKKLFIPLFMLLAAQHSYADSKTETIEVDGIERSYLVYTPTKTDNPASRSILIFLHGLGGAAEHYARVCNAQVVSDTHNALLVFPQALPEQNDEIQLAVNTLKNSFSDDLDFKNSWGAGARVSVETIKQMAGPMASMLPLLIPNVMERGYGELNESVDDVKFFNSIIETLQKSETYRANDTVYMAGASMGGAMTYKYAYSDECRAQKICILCGFVGGGVDTTQKALKVPALIFHSKADSTVKYAGGLFNGPVLETIQTITSQKGCGEGVTTDVPDTKEDGVRLTKTEYNCSEENEVVYYESDVISHSMILVEQVNDIGFITEMERFFYGSVSLGVDEIGANTLACYPNPVEDKLYCPEEGRCEVFDWSGRLLLSDNVERGVVDLSLLPSGSYLFRLTNREGEMKHTRFVKK